MTERAEKHISFEDDDSDGSIDDDCSPVEVYPKASSHRFASLEQL